MPTMPRLELQLFLWVTAVALVALGIFRGSAPVPRLLLDEFDTDSAPVVNIADHRTAGALGLRADLFTDDAFLGSGSRPIFREQAVTPTLADIDVVVTSMHVLPILKGIISSGKELRAVFASSSDAYLVVGPGEHVAEFTIVSIAGDQVLAHDDLGVSQVFALRGAGEN